MDTEEFEVLKITLEESLQQATPIHIADQLAPLAVVTALMTDELESKVVMKCLVDDLAEIPSDLIEKACKLWRQSDGKEFDFFPRRSGQLIALIADEWSMRKKYLARLETLLNVAKNPAPDGILTSEWLFNVRIKGAE